MPKKGETTRPNLGGEQVKEIKQDGVKLKPAVLKDPTTGQPLRNQDPGVPNSPWVGTHNVHDMDNKDINERKDQNKANQERLEQDFGDEDDEEELEEQEETTTPPPPISPTDEQKPPTE